MPKVPTLEQQVRRRGVQSGGFNINTPLEAFGGGQVARDLESGINSAVGQITQAVQKERKRANDTQIQDAETELAKRQGELQVNVSQMKGKDSYGAANFASKEWQKNVEEIKGLLNNDEQKARFEQIQKKRFVSLNTHAYRHAAVEGDRYELESTNEAIKVYQDEGVTNYTNGPALGESLANQEMAIRKYGENSGKSPAWIKSQVERVKSETHSGVVDRMVNNGQDIGAKEYFKAVKKDLTKDDFLRIEKIVKEGSLRGESQRKVDDLVEKHPTMTAALEDARKISDPKLRDETVRRVRSRFAENKEAERLGQQQLFANVSEKVEQAKSRDEIPASEWLALTDGQRKAVDSRIKQLRSGQEPETDFNLYYDMKTLASSPASRGKFLKADILQMRHKLGDSEFKELVNLQIGLRNKDEKAKTAIDGYRSDKSIVDGTIKEMGLNLNTKDETEIKKMNTFRRMADERLMELQRSSGKKPTNEDVQKIVDDLSIEVVTSRGVFWDTKKRIFELDEEDKPEIAFEDIPKDELRKIKNALSQANAKGGKRFDLSNDTILALYIKNVERKLDARK